MKRTAAIVGAWILATILSVTVASAAVLSVRDEVVEAPIAAGVPSTLATSTTRPSTVTTTVLPETSTTTTTVPPATTTTTTPATTTTTTEAPLGGAGAPSTTTSSTTTTVPPTTTTTTTNPPAPQYATCVVKGGSASFEGIDGEVRYLGATPEGGFYAEWEQEGPGKVEVKFESATHESRCTAEWKDGGLVVKKEEKPKGEDDD